MLHNLHILVHKLNAYSIECDFEYTELYYVQKAQFVNELIRLKILSSWFVTMQICAVSFQSWRNVFGLLLRELRPWRLH